MPKAGELTYLSALSDGRKEHAENKPFSDTGAGHLFADLGMMRMLLHDPPGRVLDLGCGTGWTSCFLAKMGYEVVGQDIAPDMIKSAIINKQRYEAHSANFVVSDYESMAYENEFDGACFFDSLHHAEDERLALEAVFRALKPGGVVVTHEPGKGHSKHEDSIHAVEEYGVTEKDMPPSHIMQIGAEIGYSKARYFPFPRDVMNMLMRTKPQSLASHRSGMIGRIGSGLRTFGARLHTLKRLFKVVNSAVDRGGLVVLTK